MNPTQNIFSFETGHNTQTPPEISLVKKFCMNVVLCPACFANGVITYSKKPRLCKWIRECACRKNGV